MNRNVVLASAFTVLLTSGLTPRTDAAEHSPSTDQGILLKTLTLNGEAVHDVGELGMNITNWGLLGSRPGSGTPYSVAPSMRYPMPSGPDHLFAAGVWMGGRVGLTAKVSTGQYEYEFGASEYPPDGIYRGKDGVVPGRRSPGFADDDHDGTDNEDRLNGYDDDQDGAIDEDYAAIGEQYFHAEMFDDMTYQGEIVINQNPMHLRIEQESFAWSADEIDDLVGVRYRIFNGGNDLLKGFSVGLFADFDVNGTPSDDLFAHDHQTVFSTLISDSVVVDVSYMFDSGPVGPFVGAVLLNHRAADGSEFSGQHGLQAFIASRPFFNGGDPSLDSERMMTLEQESFDPAPSPSNLAMANDYRILLTAGPFGDVAPGQEVVFEFAFVAGADHAALLANAANAVALARGQSIDGVQLPWMPPRPTEAPETPLSTRFDLSISPSPFNPHTEIRFTTQASGVASIEVFDLRGRRVRRIASRFFAAGEHRLRWDGLDDAGRPAASGTYFVRAQSPRGSVVRRAVLVR